MASVRYLLMCAQQAVRLASGTLLYPLCLLYTSGWQVVTNVATTVVGGVLNGDDGTEIAMQAAASGTVSYTHL